MPGIDVRLNADNAEQFLLVDQYIEFDGDNPQRKELLGDVAEATFDALTSRPLPGVSRLVNVLGPLVEAGHLRFSVTDPTAEAFFDEVGLSGQWNPTPGSDYLSVRSTDLDANKIDAFLFRDIDVATTVDPATGELRSTVTVTLRNDAPPDGLPRYLIGNGTGRPSGTNRNRVTLYTPHQLTSATVDGETTGASREREFDGPVYAVEVEIPPLSTRTVVMELQGVVPAWPYSLEILTQPTANPDQMTIRVDGAPGFGPSPQFSGPLGPPVRLPDDEGR